MRTRSSLVLLAAAVATVFPLAVSAQPGEYRHVLVDPAGVAFRAGWLREVNASRPLAGHVRAGDAARLAGDLGIGLEQSILEAFRARGFQVATAPGPGVLRVSPRIEALDVHGPDSALPGARVYVREAGSATIILQGRDAVTGKAIRTFRETNATMRMAPGLSRANAVSNQAQFEALFRRSAVAFAASFPAP